MRLALAIALAACSNPSPLDATLATPSDAASPRIRELARTGDVDGFWASLAGHAPLVEPYPGVASDVLVTFAYRSPAPYVALLLNPDFRDKPMVRLAGTDLWYLSLRAPRDARLDYAFLPTRGPPENVLFAPYHGLGPRGDRKVPDPNNAATHGDMSRFELAPRAPVTAAPKGTVIETTLASAALGEDRRVGVYLPPGHDPARVYPLLIAFDGESYGLDADAQLRLPEILDGLIAAKRIPPIVAALVANHGKRRRDLLDSAPFARFVAEELVPRLRTDRKAGLAPGDTIVTGSSLGGLAAAYVGFHHADVVGNVLAQSGAFQFRKGSVDNDVADWREGNWLTRDFAAAPKLPIHFYLDAGIYEGFLLESNRHLRDVLVAKGYDVTYAEFSGGHDPWMWRDTIGDGLAALLAH